MPPTPLSCRVDWKVGGQGDCSAVHSMAIVPCEFDVRLVTHLHSTSGRSVSAAGGAPQQVGSRRGHRFSRVTAIDFSTETKKEGKQQGVPRGKWEGKRHWRSPRPSTCQLSTSMPSVSPASTAMLLAPSSDSMLAEPPPPASKLPLSPLPITSPSPAAALPPLPAPARSNPALPAAAAAAASAAAAALAAAAAVSFSSVMGWVRAKCWNRIFEMLSARPRRWLAGPAKCRSAPTCKKRVWLSE